MKCEKCGKEIHSILTNMFNRDGSDSEYEFEITEESENAVLFTTDSSWCGYELSEEEQMEEIMCPYCKQFPFKHKEVQVNDVVVVVCFKNKEAKDEIQV